MVTLARATTAADPADVALVCDDPLRTDVLHHGLRDAGVAVDVVLVGDRATRTRSDAPVALVDVVDRVDLAAIGVTATRIVVLSEHGACQWVPSGRTERLDASTSMEEAARALLDPCARLPVVSPPPPPGADRSCATRLEDLTPRERDVLRQLITGDDGATIGARLGISEHTVRTHVQNLLPKLGVTTRADAAIVAMDLGLTSPGTEQSDVSR